MPPTAHSSAAPDAPTVAEPRGPRNGLSRRGLLGRAGLGAGAVGVLTGGLPPVARAQAGARPGLPTLEAVRARREGRRLIDLEVVELAVLLQEGETTSVELTEAYLARIDQLNGEFEVYGDNGGYNAFVRVDRDDALAGARAADARLDAGRSGGPPAPYLCGIPIGVKDSIGLKGRQAKNGSVAFSGNVAREDAVAMARLRAQGVVFIGHTICSAFSGAIIGTFAGNAWDRTHFPGGSSQGSGVAPMARLAAAAIGEETGGSITFPASANGASAIKPSLGTTSVAGVMPLTVGTDVIGPITRSMRDAALLQNAMVGPDVEDDPQTLIAPRPTEVIPIAPREGDRPLAGVRIGVPQNDFMTGTTNGTSNAGRSPQATYSPENREAFDRLRGQLADLGATVVDFALASVSGVMPLSASYDVVGPMARSGRDAALIMNAILGPDPAGDPQTLAAPDPFPVFSISARGEARPLAGLTIGVPQTDYVFVNGTVQKSSPQSHYDADHRAAFDRVRGELQELGAEVRDFRGLDITEYGEAPQHLGENPYYLNPAVLQTVDGTNVTPRIAVVNPNRAEIRYVEAVKAFAETQDATVRANLEAQYGRRPGGSTTEPATFDASIAFNAGISNAARREGERRRRLLITQYQQALDRDGIDVMLVMSIGAEVGVRNPASSGAGLPVRRYNQIANDLSWPMVSFPVGLTSGKGLAISVQLWGPCFSEPRLVQAMIDYQDRHPEHHTRFPSDPGTPAPRSASPTLRRRADPVPEDDPGLTNDPVVEELAAIARRG